MLPEADSFFICSSPEVLLLSQAPGLLGCLPAAVSGACSRRQSCPRAFLLQWTQRYFYLLTVMLAHSLPRPNCLTKKGGDRYTLQVMSLEDMTNGITVWAAERESSTKYSSLDSKLTFVLFPVQICKCDLKANKNNTFSHCS